MEPKYFSFMNIRHFLEFVNSIYQFLINTAKKMMSRVKYEIKICLAEMRNTAGRLLLHLLT
jgi:hypothetical protein